MTPRCAWVGNVNRATEGSPRHLRHELRRFSRAACANSGLVLAGRPPRGYLVFTFQPIVVARMGGRLETLSSGASEVGAVNVFTPFDWWRFVHGPGPAHAHFPSIVAQRFIWYRRASAPRGRITVTPLIQSG